MVLIENFLDFLILNDTLVRKFVTDNPKVQAKILREMARRLKVIIVD